MDEIIRGRVRPSTDDGKVGLDIHIPRKGHATVIFSSGSSLTFPDEAWPRVMAMIREEQELSPPAEAAPKAKSSA